MPIAAQFAHCNLVAKDWRKLAAFYENVFGCTRVPPARHLTGPWLARATGVPDAKVYGIHLRLPGCGEAGPTLEIFQYTPECEGTRNAINRPGLAHLAFAVDDVPAARDAVLAAGGDMVGEVTTVAIPNAGTSTFVYLTDPEGNILELQQWSA